MGLEELANIASVLSCVLSVLSFWFAKKANNEVKNLKVKLNIHDNIESKNKSFFNYKSDVKQENNVRRSNNEEK